MASVMLFIPQQTTCEGSVNTILLILTHVNEEVGPGKVDHPGRDEEEEDGGLQDDPAPVQACPGSSPPRKGWTSPILWWWLDFQFRHLTRARHRGLWHCGRAVHCILDHN